MNKKTLVIILVTFVFLEACDVGNNSHIKLRSYQYPSQINQRKVRLKNHDKTNIDTSYILSYCQEFMEYEMGFPRNGKWSSQKNMRKTIEGWEWRGWVDVYGEVNKFVCTVDNNGVRVSTNFEDSYNYEYNYTY